MADPKCTACNGKGVVDYCWHDRTCDGMWHPCDWCVVNPTTGKNYRGEAVQGRRDVPKRTKWIPVGEGFREDTSK